MVDEYVWQEARLQALVTGVKQTQIVTGTTALKRVSTPVSRVYYDPDQSIRSGFLSGWATILDQN